MSVPRVALLAAAVAVCAGCASSSATRSSPFAGKKHFAGTLIPQDSPAPDFALRDQNGRLVRLSAQRGRFVFLTFLYTHCRDVCPLISGWLDAAVRGLGTRADDVTILAVSVDPAGDTPTAVRAYVRGHHLGPQFHWLLGTRAQLAPVWQDYNVLVEVRNIALVSHAAPVFLLDRSGRPRLFYPPPHNQGEFPHDLRLLVDA